MTELMKRYEAETGKSVRRSQMTVYEITKKYLIENGYDGLFTDECGCLLDDLMPCDCDCSYCQPGYKLSAKEANRLGYEVEPDWDYIVCGK